MDFSSGDSLAFRQQLEINLKQLHQLFEQPPRDAGFDAAAASIGSELEMYIVDHAGKPLPINQQVVSAAADSALTLELNRYNLEYNLSPYSLNSNAFSATEQEILEKVQNLDNTLSEFDARVAFIGILPTLSSTDFGSHCVTDRIRFHALVKTLIERRGSEFKIDINGLNPLQLEMDNITLEGANTSFQLHYRVQAEHYADTYNAIQLVTPLVLGAAANSPTLFGHKLWAETRVPLFKQSIDTRQADRYDWNQPARVNFGHGWVREGAFELFQEAVRLYPPLLPVCSSEHQAQTTNAAPALSELRLHQSTIWSWNRAVYDDVDGGHLRIEMRALPAGPTAVDMMANAALYIGLAEGIRPHIKELLPALPFATAEYNFYRAAQFGLDANIIWPHQNQNTQQKSRLIDVLRDVLPMASEGLARIGVEQREANYYLSIIEQRIARKMNGAQWQLNCLQAFEQRSNRDQALHEMLERYMALSASNYPVADWAMPA